MEVGELCSQVVFICRIGVLNCKHSPTFHLLAAEKDIWHTAKELEGYRPGNLLAVPEYDDDDCPVVVIRVVGTLYSNKLSFIHLSSLSSPARVSLFSHRLFPSTTSLSLSPSALSRRNKLSQHVLLSTARLWRTSSRS